MAANEEGVAAVVPLFVDKDEPNTEDDEDLLLAVALSTAAVQAAVMPSMSSSSLLVSPFRTLISSYLIGCFGTSRRTPAIGIVDNGVVSFAILSCGC